MKCSSVCFPLGDSCMRVFASAQICSATSRVELPRSKACPPSAGLDRNLGEGARLSFFLLLVRPSLALPNRLQLVNELTSSTLPPAARLRPSVPSYSPPSPAYRALISRRATKHPPGSSSAMGLSSLLPYRILSTSHSLRRRPVVDSPPFETNSTCSEDEEPARATPTVRATAAASEEEEGVAHWLEDRVDDVVDEAERLWHLAVEKGRKGALLCYEELPHEWRGNQYILEGYRFISDDRAELYWSALKWHNEVSGGARRRGRPSGGLEVLSARWNTPG